MNRLIVFTGTVCSLLWAFVTAMTFGLPQGWCEKIDRWTDGVMSREVFQMANGFYYDVSNNDMPTVVFLIVFAVIFVLVFFLVSWIERRQQKKGALGYIIGFAVLFRMILLPGELIHENDIYRYLWDGKAMVHGINPYQYAPADLFMYEHGYSEDYYDSYRKVTIKGKTFTKEDDWNLQLLGTIRDENKTLYDRIGHWQVPTIYPPAAQVLFSVPAMINGDSLILMKSFFVLFDLASFFLIISLLRHFRMNPCLSVIYGWSPLVLFAFANGGHYDAIPIFFTLLSLFCFVNRGPMLGTSFLAVAALAKFYAGVLLPIVTRPLKMRYILWFMCMLIFAYIPYLYWNDTGVKGVFEGLLTYAKQWSYQAGLFTLIRMALGSISPDLTVTLIPSKIAAGGLYAAVWIFLVLQKNKSELGVIHKCFWATAMLFVLNPVADPWYFCWVMPFLCFFPYRSWYLLSGLLMLSYLNFHSDIGMVNRHFAGIPYMTWLIYAPFFACLALELLRRPRFFPKSQNL